MDDMKGSIAVDDIDPSFNATSSVQQFGLCGRIIKRSTQNTTIQDLASQHLTWNKNPVNVLVIIKLQDLSVLPPFIELITWLMQEKSMTVFVENFVLEDAFLSTNSNFMEIREKLNSFQDGKDKTDKIDLIICLGEDEILLRANLLFQQSIPPIMAFHLDSLGLVTPLNVDNFQQEVTNVLEGHAMLTLRSRLGCKFVKKNEEKPQQTLQVLNEVIIGCGPSSFHTYMDLYINEKYITTVQGLIVSTPTGSTAYAATEDASMIHPSVPVIMVTPICPDSLSSRPIVVPANLELKIMLNPVSKAAAWVSFDGLNQEELCTDDSLQITASIFPISSVCAKNQIADWFYSLTECLHWNTKP